MSRLDHNDCLSLLTQSQISEFVEQGVLVVPSLLSLDEVASLRLEFHEVLRSRYGVEADPLLPETGRNLARASSTRGAGGILDIFYESFQLKLAQNPKIVLILCELWERMRSTFPPHLAGFAPDKALASVDRVCFRVPDNVSMSCGTTSRGKTGKLQPLQRHLAPHLDCCPIDHGNPSAPQTKWRPIQCFIALSDCLSPDQGGFEACRGLHRSFEQWAANRIPSATGPPPCVGEFTPMRPVEDADILARMEHISCCAGDLVLWDNRIPHANSRSNVGPNAREVVYLKVLPHCDVNLQYVANQQKSLLAREPPTDFWVNPKSGPASIVPAVRVGSDEAGSAGIPFHPSSDSTTAHAAPNELTELGKRLFGLQPWSACECVADFLES